MRDNARIWRIVLMSLLTAGVMVYFAIEAWHYYADPFATVLAYPYEIEESVELSGYVVRDERLLPESGSGFLRVDREEGERVSVGGIVARVYAGQEDLNRKEEMDALSGWLEQLQEAKTSAMAAQSTARIDSTIFHTFLEYRQELASGRLDLAEGRGEALKSLLPQRESLPSDMEGLNREIAAAEARLEELRTQDAPSVREIAAPVSGLYSASADGYETLLTPAMLDTLTPSRLSGLEPAETGGTVGKLILGKNWFFAAALPAAEARGLRDYVGKELRLRFSRGVERDFPVTLLSLSGEENGLIAAVFQGETYLSEITLLRSQTAQVVTGTAEGLRVPREALRMENGGEGRTGLYCVVGNQARFKPVEVTYRGKDFLLVQSGSTGKEDLRVRAGDEVIVQGSGLTDGRVLTEAF